MVTAGLRKVRMESVEASGGGLRKEDKAEMGGGASA